MYAVVYNSVETLLFLKRKYTFLINRKSKGGYTSLMFSVLSNSLDCTKLLLDEVGLQDENGFTALMHAVSKGYS